MCIYSALDQTSLSLLSSPRTLTLPNATVEQPTIAMAPSKLTIAVALLAMLASATACAAK
jgi:hypothetical protein